MLWKYEVPHVVRGDRHRPIWHLRLYLRKPMFWAKFDSNIRAWPCLAAASGERGEITQ